LAPVVILAHCADFLRLAGYADVTQHTNKEASSCMFCRRGGKCLWRWCALKLIWAGKG